MIETEDLLEYHETDTLIPDIMVDIGSPFPNHGKVKKIQFCAGRRRIRRYDGGIGYGDGYCATWYPGKFWPLTKTGITLFVGIFKSPKDNSACGGFDTRTLQKVTVVDGVNTVNFPGPNYADVEEGDRVGWTTDSSQNRVYCWPGGENNWQTSDRARFDDSVTLDVVPDPDSPLVRDSHAYKFRPSYKKYALQTEFCMY
jgi:hypothetical protein